MPNTTDKSFEEKLIAEINEWDVDKCVVMCKMIDDVLPPSFKKAFDTETWQIEEGGIIHMNLRHYLILHFEKLELENSNGKDES